MALEFDPGPGKLERQWLACKKANPWLIPKLAKMARELKNCGHDHYGISGLFEALRWESYETGDLGLKINNNHRAFAARDLMERYPDLKGFFRIRLKKPEATSGKSTDLGRLCVSPTHPRFYHEVHRNQPRPQPF